MPSFILDGEIDNPPFLETTPRTDNKALQLHEIGRSHFRPRQHPQLAHYDVGRF